MTHCLLQNGTRRMYSWIPDQFAKPKTLLRLKEDGVWQNGWIVMEAYQTISDIHDEHKYRDRIKSKR